MIFAAVMLDFGTKIPTSYQSVAGYAAVIEQQRGNSGINSGLWA